MKICKGNKKSPHEQIAYSDVELDEMYEVAYPVGCPLCTAIRCFKQDEEVIKDMHETALRREDYICKIEEQNTKLEEALKNKNPGLFSYETITWEEIPIKSSKKRSHKKKSNPEQEK